MIGSIYRTHHLITAVLVSTLYSLDFHPNCARFFREIRGSSDYEIRQVPTHGCYEAFTGFICLSRLSLSVTETCWATSLTHRESIQDILEYTCFEHILISSQEVV